MLIGNPDIYGRMGFKRGGLLSHGNLDRRYVRWLALEGPTPRGEVEFAPAFKTEGQAHR